MGGLSTKDLRAVLSFLQDARSVTAPVPFTREIVDRLVEVVGCEFGRYKELDLAHQVEVVTLPCTAERNAFGDCDQMTSTDWAELLGSASHRARLSERSEIFSHAELVARDLTVSDSVGIQEKELGSYGFVDRMWVRITGTSWAGFAFDSSERVFCERDREVARVLRPHLAELWRAALVRRRLRAALAALDLEGHDGVLLLDESGEIEFASDSAERLLRDHFDERAMQLPDEITHWRDGDPCIPLVVRTGGSSLEIESAVEGFALLLRERPLDVERLTPREREVMRCVAAGLSNEEIACQLWIAVPTVRKHLEHVYDKLGVRNRIAAVAKLEVAPTESVS
jgi:DNA-binding CsgD family transcriptional regulator